MIPAPVRSVLCLAAAAALSSGCQKPDPLAWSLAQRRLYQVAVVTFSQREGGDYLVELEVRTPMGGKLKTLTATLRQHDASHAVLREDRVPLDLTPMDATGSLRVYARIPAANGPVDSLSALVELDPPRSDYNQFPELDDLVAH
ncbi:MAG: hypothetical protein ACE5HD_03550 [Acidobacteriota bacterium]